jgi:hypothetical protein
MYESNDTEHSLACNLHALDNETLEIMPPERAGRILMPAPTFQLPHRSARKVRLQRVRPTLQMLIQRRLRANEERSRSAPRCKDSETHTFSDRSAK